MEEKDTKKVYSTESVQSQLDRVLDKLDNVEEKKSAEDKVFAKSADDIAKKPKKSNFQDIGWYVELVKKWVIFLAALEILVYILALIKSINLLMMEVVDPLLLIVDFFVFGYLMWRVKRKEKETMWQGAITCFFAGFGLGLIMSIFKVFWVREFWTIFNLITEPVFMGLVAGGVGLIIGLFIKRKKI